MSNENDVHNLEQPNLPQKKNSAVIILLSCILVIVIAILAIQIVQLSGNTVNGRQMPNPQEYSMPFQNESGASGNNMSGDGGEGQIIFGGESGA